MLTKIYPFLNIDATSRNKTGMGDMNDLNDY